jgi:hypothetical protein
MFEMLILFGVSMTTLDTTPGSYGTSSTTAGTM